MRLILFVFSIFILNFLGAAVIPTTNQKTMNLPLVLNLRSNQQAKVDKLISETNNENLQQINKSQDKEVNQEAETEKLISAAGDLVEDSRPQIIYAPNINYNHMKIGQFQYPKLDPRFPPFLDPALGRQNFFSQIQNLNINNLIQNNKLPFVTPQYSQTTINQASQISNTPNPQLKANQNVALFSNKDSEKKTPEVRGNVSSLLSILKNQTLLQQKLSQISSNKNGIKVLSISDLTQKPSQVEKASLSSSTSSNIRNQSPKETKEVPKKEIMSRQFEGVGLYHKVPLTFTQGEVFRFSGVVLDTALANPSSRSNFVNIIFNQRSTGNQIRCSQEVNKNYQFQISCKLSKAGRYYMSIFAGQFGRSSFSLRTIAKFQNRLFENLAIQGPQAKNLRLEIVDNELFAVWESKAALTNVTLYQYDNNNQIIKRQYLLSNYHTNFSIPFKEFFDFVPKQTFIQISHANSLDGTLQLISSRFGSQKSQLKFQAVQHAFSQTVDQLVNYTTNIPWRMNVGEKFTFKATFGQRFKNQVYIVQPDLKIRKLYFIRQQNRIPIKQLKQGTPISIQLSFQKEGVHILQINSVSGMALINRPVYVGQIYPLLPDFSDLTPKILGSQGYGQLDDVLLKYYSKTTEKINIKQPPKNSSLTEKRQFMLALLNGLRKKYLVQPLVLDDQLNAIAQMHSDDMAQRKYFGHVSPDGEGPGQRAKKMNFSNSIGQNIAQANFLVQAHLGLQRSAAHLQNSIGSLWTRVGIGITIAQNNQYKIAFAFSTRDFRKFPLTRQQQKKFQEQIIRLIKQKNPNIVRQNVQISGAIQQWANSNKNTQFLQYVANKVNYRGSLVGSYFTFNYTEDWVERLKQSKIFEGFDKFKQVGVDVKNQNNGQVVGYMVYN